MKQLTGLQKGLLIWALSFLIGAEGAKYLSLAERPTKLIGLTELGLGIVTGIAIGIATAIRMRKDSRA